MVISLAISAAIGSPPLARGVQTTVTDIDFSIRITPACAGSTNVQVPHKLSDKDHPRLRGEYTFVNSFNPQLTGSPPLARGVRTTINLCSIERRITPACAGSTCRTHEGLEAVEDHPRLRGEYYYHSHTESLLEGSPPLARGVRVEHMRDLRQLRITPACAGSTDFKTLGAKKYWDHPRLRGEYCKRMHRLLRRRGSPPLARGVLLS